MSEITIHTGSISDQTMLHIDWYDHNNIQKRTDILISIEPEDKPRTLIINIYGKVVFQQNERGKIFA